MRLELTAVFRRPPEGGYVAFVEEMPGAMTQGETLDEARATLEDAVRRLIEARREMAEREVAGEPVFCESLLMDVSA